MPIPVAMMLDSVMVMPATMPKTSCEFSGAAGPPLGSARSSGPTRVRKYSRDNGALANASAVMENLRDRCTASA